MTGRRALPAGRRNLILIVVVAVVLVTAGFHFIRGANDTEITLRFSQTKGLYKGDTVAVLGVKVGRVLSVHAEPSGVVVKVRVRSSQKIPADAKAVLVAPTLVSIRRIELAPVYSGGPVMQDGDTIPESRTAVPVEWDDIKDQLVRLSDAIGPNGANKNGSLGRLLEVGAKNLHGQGARIGETLNSLADAMETLSASGGDVFATLRNLQVFTKALEQSDALVATFNARFASVSGILAEDSGELSAALVALEKAFPKVQRFIKTNGDELISTVDALRAPTKLLSDNRQNLADVLQVVPGTLSNFYNIFDPDLPGPTGELTFANVNNIGEFVCSSLLSLGGTPQQCVAALGPVAKYLNLGTLPVGLIPILRDGRDNVEPASPTSGGRASTSGIQGTTPPTTAPAGGFDALLGALLGGSR